PNRFTALITGTEEGTRRLASSCEQACRDAWKLICNAVHDLLISKVRDLRLAHGEGWDRLWDDQLKDCFEIRTAVLPLAACDDAAVARLLETPPKADTEEGRLYMARMELLGGLLEA